MEARRLLMVYPRQGMSGSFVNHMPLSVLYGVVDAMKAGFEVDVLDMRLKRDWQAEMAALITDKTMVVGISVMTGTPIAYAQEVSAWVKQHHPRLTVVWGGPHVTFNETECLQDANVDFGIAGYGSEPFALLCRALRGDADAPALADINGLVYRGPDGQAVAVPTVDAFEFIDWRDIPYHLIEADLDRYGQLDSGKRIFSMYSVMGCPYKCSFCSSPAQYSKIKKKYQPLTATDVADHIQHVVTRYKAEYIYFIDDDSFAKLKHVEDIIDEINRRGIKVGLGFRGARVNEIKRMSDEFLTKLAQAGTDIMHIGAESGSQKILDLIRKDCTVDDIIEVNRKMARHPEIKTAYNWIVGLPTETIEDLRASQRLMMRLIEDNPNAILFIPNKFRPLPGTELFALALQHGYQKPTRLKDWVDVEAEGSYRPPWYSDEIARTIQMMQVVSYFVDDKIRKVATGKTFKYRIARLAAVLYAPLAKLRLRHGFSAFLVEWPLFQMCAAYYRG